MASKSNRRQKDLSKMGKGSVWSEFETVELCAAWLATSEDPIRGAGHKKATFFERVYEQWCKNVGSEVDQRSEKAIVGRWKKMQPDVTKFEGIFLKLKSLERSGWSEQMYVENAAKIFQKRAKQPFEYPCIIGKIINRKYSSSESSSPSSVPAIHGEDAIRLVLAARETGYRLK